MGKINVLSFDVANLIAAGEVVDRPASVVKELLENAIDAGATSITVEIRRGGVSLIRVADNGRGIEPEDMPIAIKRHATSKISGAEDLASIMTLGFRGEALAAIASVCSMHIISKPPHREMGTMLVSEGGRVTEITEVGCADGTTVTVEELFGNVPARRKFLKKDVTEAMAVTSVVEKVAMSRPDIAMRLIIDGATKIATAGDGKPENTLYALYGREFAGKLIPVQGELSGIRVSGYIGRSDFVRNNRNYQNTFINSRYVKSKTVMAALEKAYTSFIAPERFPIAILFLTLDPATVDVNVHPAKLEVKFSDERPIFEVVYYAVRTALEESSERPELRLQPEKRPAIGAFVPVGGQKKAEQTDLSAWLSVPGATARPVGTVKVTPPPRVEEKQTFFATDYAKAHAAMDAVRQAPAQSVTVASPLPKAEEKAPDAPIQRTLVVEKATEVPAPIREEVLPLPVYRLIGEAFDCYILIELDGELWVIDKHAAHERILFEELKERMQKDGRIASQSLLLPLRVKLTEEEIAAAEEYTEQIGAVGFSYRIDGGYAEISALPDAITPAGAEMLFLEMTDELARGTGNPAVTEAMRREKTLYQIACKGAIKGGRVYSTETVRWLVERLLRMPDVTCCPHGRPVAYRLTKGELDRQFQRI